jgi:MoaA/NifB/PqqE/SkfB family radical SAM enzyme
VIPRIVILPLQYVCDARCVMCNIWTLHEKRHWEPEELERVLSHPALADNVEVVNVTGGEPTMRPDLLEIFEVIVRSLRALHTVSLQTNGISAARTERRLTPVVELLEAENAGGRAIHFDVNISCDGPGRIHDRVRGVPGAWKSLTETVAVAKQLVGRLERGDVTLNLTIVRQNVWHLRQAELAAAELGVPITFTFPQTTEVYVANCESSEQFELTVEERSEVVEFLRGLQTRLTGRSAMSRRYCAMLVELLTAGERRLGCPLSTGGLFLEPGGRALPCWRSAELVSGNILDDGVDAVLGRRDAEDYRTVLRGHCSTCPSNCYVDWNRRMFARAAGQGAVRS